MSSNWQRLLQKQRKQQVKSSKTSKSVKSNKVSKSVRVPLSKIVELQKAENVKQANNSKPLQIKKSESDNISNREKEIGRFLAIDCEFVGVGPEGVQSELARVSIVNYHCHTVYDRYVKPREKVTDWRTHVSGIRPSDMHNAISFKQAQQETADLLKDRILIGHAVHHDLEALYLTHPKKMIRDTAGHTPFKQKYSKGKTPSLKKLAQEILGWNIQGGEHSSVEDAKATMFIYKSDKKNFEAKARSSKGK